jgi:hypothetical protein
MLNDAYDTIFIDTMLVFVDEIALFIHPSVLIDLYLPKTKLPYEKVIYSRTQRLGV